MGKHISKLEEFDDVKILSKLYHGTSAKHGLSLMEGIDCGKSEKTKDFGKGFYLTSSFVHAEASAINTAKNEESTPLVIEYKINKSSLKVNNSILIFTASDEEWLGYIFSNKNPKKRQTVAHFPNKFNEKYDIVYGPLADGAPKYIILVNEFEKLANVSEQDKIDLLKAIRSGYKFPEVDQFVFKNQTDINKMLVQTRIHIVKQKR